MMPIFCLPDRSVPMLAAVLLIASGTAFAQPADKVLAGANRNAGKQLHQDKNCASCHAQRFGGDGSSMYTRLDHKVTSPEKLLGQVSACNTRLSAGLFPDDERDVAAYLNHDYYHFK